MIDDSNTTQLKTLRLILGDQLNAQHSWFNRQDESVLYLIAELHQEASYVKHHIQKLCAFFAAMASFAADIRGSGHNVLHLTLDDTIQHDGLTGLLTAICRQYEVTHFEFQAPDEYRLRQQLRGIKLPGSITAREVDSEHFLLPEVEFKQYIVAAKHNRMETFYRSMRKRLNLLMHGDQPEGGQWNFDSDNRKKLRPQDLAEIPDPLLFQNNVERFLKRIEKHGIGSFGERKTELIWPVNRSQALALLDFFCTHCLKNFGRFQDAMSSKHESRWSLYHSRLSFALNSKILHPMEVVNRAIQHYEEAAGDISLAQIEGFVRQIIGWREYVRAVYWLNMPGYKQLNHLQAKRDLPQLFWHGKTRMKCMQQAVGQSLEFAYAHHIQRLMITGNFCLLTGIDPAQVDNWYLGVYIDAIEWVELPNTLGMSQFADGGLIATKPYAASGNYINKMSDYCKNCHYNVKQKSDMSACPFNSLYWGFMIQHRQMLTKNPRVGMIYGGWDRQGTEEQNATLARANWCLENLEIL